MVFELGLRLYDPDVVRLAPELDLGTVRQFMSGCTVYTLFSVQYVLTGPV